MEVLGTDQFTNKVTIELSSRAESLDVFFVRPLNDLKLFSLNGWFEDLTPHLANDKEFDLDDFFDGALESCMKDGKLYGVPIVAESQIVYYRKDIFAKHGITRFPQTMDELYEVALKLTDKKNDFYGYVGRKKQPSCYPVLYLLTLFGGDLIRQPKSDQYPEAIQAFKFYGKPLRDCGPPG